MSSMDTSPFLVCGTDPIFWKYPFCFLFSSFIRGRKQLSNILLLFKLPMVSQIRIEKGVWKKWKIMAASWSLPRSPTQVISMQNEAIYHFEPSQQRKTMAPWRRMLLYCSTTGFYLHISIAYRFTCLKAYTTVKYYNAYEETMYFPNIKFTFEQFQPANHSAW